MTFFQYIYYLKPWLQLLLCVAGWAVWTIAMILLVRRRRMRTCLAIIGIALSLALILYQTLMLRSGGARRYTLRPFTIVLKAMENREYYRSMALNAILFTPFGMTAATLLSQKLSAGKSVGYAVLLGFLTSATVEAAQYVFALGIAETDDLILNTLGAFFGAAHVWIVSLVENRRKTKE